MDAQSDRGETFAALAAAVGQNGAAAFAGIAVEKPVLAFAADFRRLILAFHKFKYARLALKLRLTERESLSVNRPLSRRRYG
jgi:hypothetical protein